MNYVGVKYKIIDALYNSSIHISKNPEMLLNGVISTYDGSPDIQMSGYFKIECNNKMYDVCNTSIYKPLIQVNYNKFLMLSESARVFVLVWCGFIYLSDLLNIIMIFSSQRETDSETIKFLFEKEYLTSDNVNELIDDLSGIITSNCSNAKTVKRINNIIKLIHNRF